MCLNGYCFFYLKFRTVQLYVLTFSKYHWIFPSNICKSAECAVVRLRGKILLSDQLIFIGPKLRYFLSKSRYWDEIMAEGKLGLNEQIILCVFSQNYFCNFLCFCDKYKKLNKKIKKLHKFLAEIYYSYQLYYRKR